MNFKSGEKFAEFILIWEKWSHCVLQLSVFKNALCPWTVCEKCVPNLFRISTFTQFKYRGESSKLQRQFYVYWWFVKYAHIVSDSISMCGAGNRSRLVKLFHVTDLGMGIVYNCYLNMHISPILQNNHAFYCIFGVEEKTLEFCSCECRLSLPNKRINILKCSRHWKPFQWL